MSSAQFDELYSRLSVIRKHMVDRSWDHFMADSFSFCQNKQTNNDFIQDALYKPRSCTLYKIIFIVPQARLKNNYYYLFPL